MQKTFVAKESLSLIQKSFLFKHFTEKDLEEVSDKTDILTFDDQEIIVEEGSRSPYLYSVLDGSAVVTVSKEDGEAYICTLGEGEVFGEAGLFTKVKRTANVRSAGQSMVLRIHRESFFTYVNAHPRKGNLVFSLIIYSLLRKLRETNQELAYERKLDMGQSDVDDLVAQLGGGQ